MRNAGRTLANGAGSFATQTGSGDEAPDLVVSDPRIALRPRRNAVQSSVPRSINNLAYDLQSGTCSTINEE